ncbi:MAG: class I SAM-dependent methyltransferase [Acidimicrobiia bacterium]|nr:class I SAM-dependent methyltransferase [Acidimicrobiia bacterium]
MPNGSVFTGIADRYDRINRMLSLGRDGAWRRSVLVKLPPGRILDLGAGTGAANDDLGLQDVVALDPSPEMLHRNPTQRRVVGVGEQLPFIDGAFDAVFSAYVFRNLDSVPGTLAEIARVLCPGGVAGVVDLGRPRRRTAAAIHRAGSGIVLGTVGVLAGSAQEYRYLGKSLDKLPQPEEMFAGGPLHLDEVWRMGPLGFVYGALLTRR